MKKTIIAIVVLLSGTYAATAQGGGQRRTVEERVKDVMEKMADLKLDKEVSKKTEDIFTENYTEQDKAMKEMRDSGGMDRDAMMAKRKELTDARDKKLKEVLTEDQFKKFKDEIEPSMRPQGRGNGGGGRNK